MKLASLKGPRDGKLCVVNRDLTYAKLVEDVAPTLQYALDNWLAIAPKLQTVYETISASNPDCFSFDPSHCVAPLPRAYQWADGSAYVNHVALVRQARKAEMPAEFWTDPLMYQGGSDRFLGPTSPIPIADEKYGIDFESEIAVITDDVPMAIKPEAAGKHIKLIMLVNDVSLRNLIPNELGKGFGFFQSKPASSFSPVAVTPDELGDAWDGMRVHLPLMSTLNGTLFGAPNAGIDMTFSFPELIAHAAKTRELGPGTIIGSGTVSNTNRTTGSSCIAEKRMLEIIATGKATTDFMHFGDTIQIEMLDKDQRTIFGAIHQEVIAYAPL